MLDMRRVALSRFGEQAIKRDEPMASLEEVLVPLYHHRHQVEATASTVGGSTTSTRCAAMAASLSGSPAAEQRAAVQALIGTIKPSELALPADLLKKIPHGRRGADGRENFAIRVRCSTRSRPR